MGLMDILLLTTGIPYLSPTSSQMSTSVPASRVILARTFDMKRSMSWACAIEETDAQRNCADVEIFIPEHFEGRDYLAFRQHDLYPMNLFKDFPVLEVDVQSEFLRPTKQGCSQSMIIGCRLDIDLVNHHVILAIPISSGYGLQVGYIYFITGQNICDPRHEPRPVRAYS